MCLDFPCSFLLSIDNQLLCMLIFTSMCTLTTFTRGIYVKAQTNWAGFPVEMPGTSDLDHHFHLAGVLVKTHEDVLASVHVNSMITYGCEALLDFVFQPEAFMTDRSWAFTKTNRELAPEGDHGLCNAHFMKKVMSSVNLYILDLGG